MAISGTPSTAAGVWATLSHDAVPTRPRCTHASASALTPPAIGAAVPEIRKIQPVRLRGRARRIAAPTKATAR